MLSKISKMPPQFRAIVATVLAGAGLSTSNDPYIDSAILLVWLAGGVLDWLAVERRSIVERKAALDKAKASARASLVGLAAGGSLGWYGLAVAGATSGLFGACGGSQPPSIEYAEATCEATVLFTYEGLQIGTSVEPMCSAEGSGLEAECTVVACVDVNGLVFCHKVVE